MATIKLIHGDAANHTISADMLLTDPPFEMGGKELASIISKYDSRHLLLICTMRQLLDFSQHTDLKFNLDFVFDLVAPKQSKSSKQPNYRHVHAVYFTRQGAKSVFDRKRGTRSDVFTVGYMPTIFTAPRERSGVHGHAKNEQAIRDLLSYFDVRSVVDPFAGSGTTGLACMELGIDCTLIERDQGLYDNLKTTFRFLGEIV